jgi:uncharacterized protein DUF6544
MSSLHEERADRQMISSDRVLASAEGFHDSGAATLSLVADLKAYCLPGGEKRARGVRGIRTTQSGEIRSAPDARWDPFTAEEFVDATRAGFRWEAHIGSGLRSVVITDAYEEGHGRLVLTKGPLQLKKLVGPEVDKGELQRYLAYLGYCPAMLLNNQSLAFSAVATRTLRVWDRHDQTGASVEVDLGDDGQPRLTRAVRPMVVGKRIAATPWSATGSDAQEWDGLRAWRRMEAAWHRAEGSFTYVRMELTSFIVLR